MKTSIKVLLLGLYCFSSVTFAGDKTGNGGTVMVCGESVKLADFAELNYLWGLKGKLNIPESDDPVEVQIQRAFDKIVQRYPFLQAPIEKEWKFIQANKKEIEGEYEYEWPPTNDLGLMPLPDGCVLKNVILYVDNGPIEVQKTLLNKLSKTHQAGLWVHEVIYKLTRIRTQQKVSVPARRLVAMLFAENADREIFRSLINRYVAPEKLLFYVEMVSGKYKFENDTIFTARAFGMGFMDFYPLNSEKRPERQNWTFKADLLKTGDYVRFGGHFYCPNQRGAACTWELQHHTHRKVGFLEWDSQTGTIASGSIPDWRSHQYYEFFVAMVSPKMDLYLNGVL